MKVIIRFLEWLGNLKLFFSRLTNRSVAAGVADDNHDAPDDNIYPLW